MAVDGSALAGAFAGEIADRWRAPDLLKHLSRLPALLAAPGAQLLAAGRNRNIRLELPVNGRNVAMMVKAFGRQAWLRDLRDARRGSKARRTYEAAVHLVRHGAGTPAPIGYLERWEDGRLHESYYLAEFQDGAQTMRDALLRLFDDRPPQAARFVGLLECMDRVIWWRLAARGFGLVDDVDPAALRARPAYAMLKQYLQLLGDATFVGARMPERRGQRHGRYRFAFRRADGEIVALTWAHGPALPFPTDEACSRVETAFGETVVAPARLAGRPFYLRGARA